MASTSFRLPPETTSSSSIRDREAAESLMQLSQGFIEEMHRKKIAATFSTPVTTTTGTGTVGTGSTMQGMSTGGDGGVGIGSGIPVQQQQQQQERSSVIVSTLFQHHHQQVPISVVKPSVEAASSSIGGRSSLSGVGLRLEDEGVRIQKSGSDSKRESVPSVSVSKPIYPLGTVAKNELEFKNFLLDSPGPSCSKGKSSPQKSHSTIEISSPGVVSYPKKKDLYNRSPPPRNSLISHDKQFSFEQSGGHATQLGMLSNVSSFYEQQQQLQQEQQRLAAHKTETPWHPIPYRPMNLGPSSSPHLTLLPGTRIIRLSDAVAAQQLSRNMYGTGDVEWRQPKQGMYENNRLKQIKSKKKVFRALIQINGDTSQPIIVDNFTIQREAWAKAFLQTQICHSAAILFKAIFTPDEIQNCTLAGRNGTNRLDLKKRAAIFRAVGWMKNKNQNPYSFDSSKSNNLEFLTEEEKMMIEKKVFVERRYQTSRKIKPNSERGNSAQLKRSASSMVDTQQRQISDGLKMFDNSVMSHEPISPSALLEIDVKPSLPLSNMKTIPSASSQEITYPNMSGLNIKQEKEDEPSTGSEEEDPFMKLPSTDEVESLPPKIAKMSTQ